jgi:hypothetical protein
VCVAVCVAAAASVCIVAVWLCLYVAVCCVAVCCATRSGCVAVAVWPAELEGRGGGGGQGCPHQFLGASYLSACALQVVYISGSDWCVHAYGTCHSQGAHITEVVDLPAGCGLGDTSTACLGTDDDLDESESDESSDSGDDDGDDDELQGHEDVEVVRALLEVADSAEGTTEEAAGAYSLQAHLFKEVASWGRDRQVRVRAASPSPACPSLWPAWLPPDPRCV